MRLSRRPGAGRPGFRRPRCGLALPGWWALQPGGLRWRLTLWVGAVMLTSFAAIFVVVYRDTGSQVTGQINRDIAGDVGQLRLAMGVTAGLAPRQISAAAGRYVRAQ